MNDRAAARVICVLGMHRSGTSCLTGSLQAAGLNLGKHHTQNRFNQKGNRENQDFIDFHDQLLADNGGSWDCPPRRIQISAERLGQARAIAENFPTDVRWGFKDPRTLLVLNVWIQTLPDLGFIGIFRHPLAVSASLNRRSERNLPLAETLKLWHSYNRRLLAHYKKTPFPLMCFDWEEERFHQRLNEILLQMSLSPLEPEQRFYAPQLRNFDSREAGALPWKIRRLYQKLQALAAEQAEQTNG